MIRILVQYLFQIVSVAILVDVILSYFMSPFHPVRSFLDRIIEPMLNPIRRIIPPIMNMDFSPVILLLVLQIVEGLLLRIF